jgi:hypothetical protein
MPMRSLAPAVRLALGGSLAVFGLALASASSAPTASQSAPAPAQSSALVGTDTCLTCHESQRARGTAHGRAFNMRTPAATSHAYESCHGPGKEHVDGGGDTTKIANPRKLAPQRRCDGLSGFKGRIIGTRDRTEAQNGARAALTAGKTKLEAR